MCDYVSTKGIHNCLESALGHFQFSVKKTGSSECDGFDE